MDKNRLPCQHQLQQTSNAQSVDSATSSQKDLPKTQAELREEFLRRAPDAWLACPRLSAIMQQGVVSQLSTGHLEISVRRSRKAFAK